MRDLAIVILAAGHGTRMKSRRQKVLHEVGGKPMVQHVVDTAWIVAGWKPFLVVGPKETGARDLFGDRVATVIQEERLGTGHAVQMAAPVLAGEAEQVLVMYGDMPLLRPETLQLLAQKQAATGAALSMLTMIGPPDSTYGRILRDEDGGVCEIMEVAQAGRRPDAEAILAIRELNVGVYCFQAEWLWANVPHLPLRQARSGVEYYLTDLVEMAINQGRAVEAVILEDADEGLGAGTRAELAQVEAAFHRRTTRKWLEAGVTLVDPAATYIDPTVTIGQDTIVWPNTFIQSGSVIGRDCRIGPNTILRAVSLGDGCCVEQIVLEGVTLPANTTLPPFTYMTAEQKHE
jgi:bifunctional UDP-N-acetylglucosamine pyrophosphorylase/glucosamine-1-phosphate N-acetyltransferase